MYLAGIELAESCHDRFPMIREHDLHVYLSHKRVSYVTCELYLEKR